MGTEKETTAPIPSVAPDGEQPFALTRNGSIPFTEEKNKSSDGMTVIPMPKLMEIRFPVKPAVIEGLLPVGTYLLAGAPKVGKSFFVLQMAYRVSTGGTFLDCPVHPGTVLYLALEDTLDRLQKRLVQMTEQDSPDLILSVLADTLDENLLAQLEGFLMDYPDTVLVIIDTLHTASAPVRLSLWRISAPSAAPIRPLVPEMVWNTSSALSLRVWCTSTSVMPWASAKVFSFANVS
mgnify:CR=1 FL=1